MVSHRHRTVAQLESCSPSVKLSLISRRNLTIAQESRLSLISGCRRPAALHQNGSAQNLDNTRTARNILKLWRGRVLLLISPKQIIPKWRIWSHSNLQTQCDILTKSTALELMKSLQPNPRISEILRQPMAALFLKYWIQKTTWAEDSSPVNYQSSHR